VVPPFPPAAVAKRPAQTRDLRCSETVDRAKKDDADSARNDGDRDPFRSPNNRRSLRSTDRRCSARRWPSVLHPAQTRAETEGAAQAVVETVGERGWIRNGPRYPTGRSPSRKRCRRCSCCSSPQNRLAAAPAGPEVPIRWHCRCSCPLPKRSSERPSRRSRRSKRHR